MSVGLRRAASGYLAGEEEGGGDPVDPIAVVGWTAAYWPEGPEFAALGLAADAAVAAFPDEKSTYDLAQGTSGDRPLYRPTGGPTGTPVLEAVSADLILRTSTPAISVPYTVVAIGKSNDASPGTRILAASDSSNGLICQDGTNWGYYNGGAGIVYGTAANTNWNLHVCYFNGASSKYDINGTNVASGNPGSGSLAGVRVFGSSSGNWVGKGAFWGYYSGDARSDGGWADFKGWVTSHYGITVA